MENRRCNRIPILRVVLIIKTHTLGDKMDFSTFIQSCGGKPELLHFYPYTKSCFDNLSEEEVSLLSERATIHLDTNIHISNISVDLETASPDLTLLWSLKALSEMGGWVHEDDVETAEENDQFYVGVIFEGVGDGIFYVDTKKVEKGVFFKVWGSYSESKARNIKEAYLKEHPIGSEDFNPFAYLMNLVPKIDEQEGIITYDDFGYDSDDILIGLRKSVKSFKEVEFA